MVLYITTEKWVKMATENDPNGVVCSFCQGKNEFADDCGWFYVTTANKEGYCCERCWQGSPGREHRERYGVGER